MRKRNLLTGKDRRAFSMKRNSCLGSLHMAKTSISNMINSDLIDLHGRQVLSKSLDGINLVLKHWDKHYCAKLFAKLNEEAPK